MARTRETYQARPAKGKGALASGKGAANAEAAAWQSQQPQQQQAAQMDVVDLTGEDGDDALPAQAVIDHGIGALLQDQQVVREVELEIQNAALTARVQGLAAQLQVAQAQVKKLEVEAAKHEAERLKAEQEMQSAQAEALRTAQLNRQLCPQVTELAEELEKVKRSRDALLADKWPCPVCMERPLKVCLPCGHCLCEECSPHAVAQGRCFMCRKKMNAADLRTLFIS